jgi:hypothetical protein
MWWTKFLMAPDQGDGGSSGNGTGTGQQGQGGAGSSGASGTESKPGGTEDILFNDTGGGTGSSGNGGGGTGQGNAQANGGDSGGNGNGGGTQNSQVSIPENWKESLPQELRADPSLEKLKSVGDVVKSYINIQKMIGQDKAIIPQKGAPPEEVRAYLEKVGLPKDAKDYSVEAPKAGQVDQPFFDGFKQAAFAAGVLPEQASKLVDWFAKTNEEAFKAQVTEHNDKVTKGINDLKAEWGDKYKENVDLAKAAMKEFATPEQQKWAKEIGLGSHPDFIKMMAKAGAGLSEAKLKGDGAANANDALTPAEAKLKIKEIESNMKHPYYDSKHADHKVAKEEMAKYYKYAYPDPTVKKSDDI